MTAATLIEAAEMYKKRNGEAPYVYLLCSQHMQEYTKLLFEERGFSHRYSRPPVWAKHASHTAEETCLYHRYSATAYDTTVTAPTTPTTPKVVVEAALPERPPAMGAAELKEGI